MRRSGGSLGPIKSCTVKSTRPGHTTNRVRRGSYMVHESSKRDNRYQESKESPPSCRLDIPTSPSRSHLFYILCIFLKQIFRLPFVCICYNFNIRFSHIILLKEMVFQLKEGHGQCNIDQCETVVIRFASSKTELTPKSFENDEEVL